jgi:hypothetical protein
MRAPDESVLSALSALLGATFIAGAVSAIVDHRYRKSGGVRPTKRHKIYVGVAGLLCIGLLVVLGFMGADPEWIGRRAADLGVLLLAVWELWRWNIRRDHPLSQMPRG